MISVIHQCLLKNKCYHQTISSSDNLRTLFDNIGLSLKHGFDGYKLQFFFLLKTILNMKNCLQTSTYQYFQFYLTADIPIL